MRKFTKLWGWIVLVAGVVAQANTVLLTDDFNDSSIDSSKWTLITATGHTSFDESAAGGTVTESATYFWIQDAIGAYKSTLLPVNSFGGITITRNIYVSYSSSTLVSMPDEIVAEDGTVLLRWGYHNYSDGGTNRYGFGGFNDTLVTGTWDSFVDETITYDPVTGVGTYSLNGGNPVNIAGLALPSGTTNLYLRGSAYAVGGGTYYKAFQNFTVSQGDYYQLTVSSAYGSPTPAVGDSMYTEGSVIDCSVTNLVYTGGWGTPVIRYQCTGWTGTGSVPASGTTNAVAVTLNEDSSIVWNWEAMDAVLTVSSAYGSSSPAVGSASYEIGTEVTCSVQDEVTVDGIRYQCTGWTGSGSVPSSGSTNSVVVTIGQTSAITWTWQNLDSKLSVVSDYGDPVPFVSNAIYSAGTVVTCSVDNVLGADTRHFCTGWQKHAYSSFFGSYWYISGGTTNWIDLTLDYADVRLTWLWETDHWLDIQVEGSGTVSHVSGFCDEGSVQTLTATPADGWVFDGWVGDVSGTGSAALTMDAPKSVTAIFSVPASIGNVSVAQVEGARTVEVSYDVNGTRGLLVDLEVYQNGSNLNASALSGAVGMVSAGPSNVVTWNAGTDWNLNVDELTFNLLTEDGLPFYEPYIGGTVSVPQTGQTNSYTTYTVEDGDILPGMEWPEPRFTDNGDNTVTDNLTGLMWGKAQSSYMSWYSALGGCENSTLAGYSDWRLPNVREMRSLLANYGRYNPTVTPGTFSMGSVSFWTGSTWEYSPGYKYVVSSGTGGSDLISTSSSAYYLPVRLVSSGPAAVVKTGQTNSWTATYSVEDGDLQMGTAPPEHRFTDNGDGTVTDNLTGLTWLQTWQRTKTWTAALSYAEALTAAGKDDWHLPSINELEMLLDYGKKAPAALLPTGHPFLNVVASSSYTYYCWSSTTMPSSSGYAFTVSFYDGKIIGLSKGYGATMLCCRGGAEVQEIIPEATTYAPLPVTGQTNSLVVGDDGDLQKGEPGESPRFVGSVVVLDTRTGLQWYVGTGFDVYWYQAVDNCESSTLAGVTDWRLPNVREMLSLIDYGESTPALPAGHPFATWTNAIYWTGTVAPENPDYRLYVNINNGSVGAAHWAFSEMRYCFVKGTSTLGFPAAVPATGQTVSNRTGDDGYYQTGIAVSGDRFEDNGNGTVNDNQTGLMWLKDAGAVHYMQWSNAVAACESLNFGGYMDWRLPNARELESLADYSLSNSVPEIFDNVEVLYNRAYWTSTTDAGNSELAFEIRFAGARLSSQYKENHRYVWPVRGGN